MLAPALLLPTADEAEVQQRVALMQARRGGGALGVLPHRTTIGPTLCKDPLAAVWVAESQHTLLAALLHVLHHQLS